MEFRSRSLELSKLVVHAYILTSVDTDIERGETRAEALDTRLATYILVCNVREQSTMRRT